jgi:hypothetical protein
LGGDRRGNDLAIWVTRELLLESCHYAQHVSY